jgi:hypothetical protein
MYETTQSPAAIYYNEHSRSDQQSNHLTQEMTKHGGANNRFVLHNRQH